MHCIWLKWGHYPCSRQRVYKNTLNMSITPAQRWLSHCVAPQQVLVSLLYDTMGSSVWTGLDPTRSFCLGPVGKCSKLELQIPECKIELTAIRGSDGPVGVTDKWMGVGALVCRSEVICTFKDGCDWLWKLWVHRDNVLLGLPTPNLRSHTTGRKCRQA